jgi:phenylacetate-coenzyme A ligase PaaK-like adenylate-forming protein
MGFLHNGELYIAGRYKDLIIIRGRNYYPEDIEATVQDSHPALQPGGGAVFSLAIAGDEQLVVTQEIRKDYKGELDLNEVIKKIRFDIAREHGIRAYAVSLIKRGNIP